MSHRGASVAAPVSGSVSGPLTRSRRALAGVAVAAACGLAACSAPSELEVTTQARPTQAPPASAEPTPASATWEDGTSMVECADAAVPRPGAVVVLADDEFRVGGWNHVNGVGSFETATLEPAAYKITAENYAADATCGGLKSLATVLAKKTYDWDKQHANGMEALFPGEDLTFGAVDDIALVITLDPELTAIPTAADLGAAYGDLLSPAELEQLDGQQVNLELTLFGQGATGDQPFMNAGTIISVDPAAAASGWVRVQVPREELTFYTEDNYVRSEVGGDAHQELTVQGLRINPETAGGQVVRHFVGDEFDTQGKPELFKEMAVTFALIEVGRS